MITAKMSILNGLGLGQFNPIDWLFIYFDQNKMKSNKNKKSKMTGMNKKASISCMQIILLLFS